MISKLINYLVKKRYKKRWHIEIAYVIIGLLGQGKRYYPYEYFSLRYGKIICYYFLDNDYELNTTSKR